MSTDQISTDDTDFGFEGTSPSQVEIDVGHKVAFVCGLLDQAARGQHTAWALSEAFASIATRTAWPVTPLQAMQLTAAANRARQGALRHLPPNYRRSAIELGMQALAIQIDRWRLTGAELRRLPHPDALDVAACARIFRNDLHNMALCEEISDRAARRAGGQATRNAAIVAEIINGALEHLPQFRAEEAE